MKTKKIISIVMGLLLSTTGLMTACSQPKDSSSTERSAIVEDIAVKTTPKTEYILGENFEIGGGVLELIYDDGTTGTINFSDEKVTVSTPDMNTIGNKTITVEYDGFTATYTIAVSALTYTVSFNYNYDGAAASVNNQVGENETVTPIVEPTRTGYRFLGWFKEKTANTPFDFDQAILANTVIYAGWQALTNVSFDLNYESSAAVKTVSIDVGSGVDETLAPATTREGYVFDGWHTDKTANTPYDFSAPVNAAVTLYAHWTEVKADDVYYKVTYNYQHSSFESRENSVLEGGKATKPQDPTLEGKSFLGWFTEPEGGVAYDFNAAVSANVTLYAHWKTEYYSVVFKYELDGQETVVRSRKVTPGNKVSAGSLPTLNGYRFVANWYSDKECTKLFDFDTVIDDDYTLYIKPLKENKFEAEYTYIDESKAGFGSSDNFSGLMLVFKDNGTASSSNGYWVSGLYYNEAFIEFVITAEKAVTNAVLELGLSSEWADVYIAPTTQNSGGTNYYGYEVAAWKARVDENGNVLKDAKGYTLYDETTKTTFDYAPLAITGAITFDQSMVDKRPFTNYTLSTSFSLSEGVNVIRLTVKNDHAAYDGTMKATAPMVDHMTIYTEVDLSWSPITQNVADPSKINGGLD